MLASTFNFCLLPLSKNAEKCFGPKKNGKPWISSANVIADVRVNSNLHFFYYLNMLRFILRLNYSVLQLENKTIIMSSRDKSATHVWAFKITMMKN